MYAPLEQSGQLLTFSQVADVLGLHPGTVRRLVASGALSAVRLWRTVRIPRADVARFAAEAR